MIKDDASHLDERIAYLRTNIVPKIDALIRDGKSKPLPDIYTSLSAEYKELQQALTDHQEPASCIGEIADLVYYSAQQEDEQLFSRILQVASAFGLTPVEALDATITKYTPRTSGVKDQELEKKLLRDYLHAQSLETFNYAAAQERLIELMQLSR